MFGGLQRRSALISLYIIRPALHFSCVQHTCLIIICSVFLMLAWDEVFSAGCTSEYCVRF